MRRRPIAVLLPLACCLLLAPSLAPRFVVDAVSGSVLAGDDDGGGSAARGVGARLAAGPPLDRAGGSGGSEWSPVRRGRDPVRGFLRALLGARPAVRIARQHRRTALRRPPPRALAARRARAVPPRIARPAEASFAPRIVIALGLTDADVAELARRRFRRAGEDRGGNVLAFRPPAGLALAQAMAVVRSVSPQAIVDLDHYYKLAAGSSTLACRSARCQALGVVGWDPDKPQSCGEPPIVAMIDSAVDMSNEALHGASIIRLRAGASLPSQDDHGTAIAALLVGAPESANPGLMPDALLLAYDVFADADGSERRTSAAEIVTALQVTTAAGARVINMSLAGPPNAVLQKAVEEAVSHGAVIVAAAGNEGPGAKPSYPAAYAGVIAVTAVNDRLEIYPRATRGAYITLSAPGVELVTATRSGSRTRLQSGTSYAAPFVSAAAAMLLADRPTLTSAMVARMLTSRAKDLGDPGFDTVFGYGLLQHVEACGPLESAVNLRAGR